jgi:hypothetical protein
LEQSAFGQEKVKNCTYQAGRVEFLVARSARKLGDLVVAAVQDRVANVALLNTLEFLVQVSLPQHQAVPNRTILNLPRIRVLI